MSTANAKEAYFAIRSSAEKVLDDAQSEFTLYYPQVCMVKTKK